MLESAFTARIINSYDQKGTTEGTSYFDAFKDDLKNNFSCTSKIRLVPHFSKKGITFWILSAAFRRRRQSDLKFVFKEGRALMLLMNRN